MNKVVFVALAIEDVSFRDLLKGQSLHVKSPFEYVDMSVKEAYVSEWKEKVRTRIRRSNGVIVLVSRNSLTSSGQKWEVQCAKEEGKPILAMWCQRDDKTAIPGLPTVSWTWDNVASFIESL